MSLRSGILQSFLMTSIQSKFVLTSLWKIFLRRLYEDILTVSAIPSKHEIFVQGIQVKPETPKTWLSLCSSLHSYSKLFYKFVTYHMFDNNCYINTWNIRRQIVGYSKLLGIGAPKLRDLIRLAGVHKQAAAA